MKTNYLEKIKQCILYIEANLNIENLFEEIIKKSHYSYPQFYRIFKNIVGETIISYIQKRRLSCAAKSLLETKKQILDIALDFGYESQQTFTRAFSSLFGISPLKYREYGMPNDMYEVFEITKNQEVDEIIIHIESLPSMITARYQEFKTEVNLTKITNLENRVISKAWSNLIKWQMLYEYNRYNPNKTKKPTLSELGNFMVTNQLHLKHNTRYFGFVTPYPHAESTYGYEVWCTLKSFDDAMPYFDKEHIIDIKQFAGGLYATAVASYGKNSNLNLAWKKLHAWLYDNKEYDYGSHQWLEEHITIENVGGFHGFKIYLPIVSIKTI